MRLSVGYLVSIFHRLWNQKKLFTKKIPMQNIAYNIQGKDEVKSHTYLMVSYAVVEATCVGPWKLEKNCHLYKTNGKHHLLMDEQESKV